MRMRLVSRELCVLVCALSCVLIDAKVKEAKILKKLDDHQSLTSGYAYHHLSTSLLPKGLEANRVHYDESGPAGAATEGNHGVIDGTNRGLGSNDGDAGHSVATVYKFSVVHGAGGGGAGEYGGGAGAGDHNGGNGAVNGGGVGRGEYGDVAAVLRRYSLARDSDAGHTIGNTVKFGEADGTKGNTYSGIDQVASAISTGYKNEDGKDASGGTFNKILTNFDPGKTELLKSDDVEGQGAAVGDRVSSHVLAPHHAASGGHDHEEDHEDLHQGSDERDDGYGGYGDFGEKYWDFGGIGDYYGDDDDDDHGYFDFYKYFGKYGLGGFDGDYGNHDGYDGGYYGSYGVAEDHADHAGGGGHRGGGGGHGGQRGGGGGIGGHYADFGNAYQLSGYFDHDSESNKGRKGHRLHHDGEHEDYDDEGYKHFHVEDGGGEKNYHDEDEVHGDHHEFEKGTKDGHFGAKKGHDKGSKTTGYHNVLHKDEYTKEHSFYDNAHRGGNFVKDGDFNAHFHAAAGDHKKGDHHDSAFDVDHSGKRDYKDKGHLVSDHVGHDRKEGFESHRQSESDSGHKGADNHGKEYGFWKHRGSDHKDDHGDS